MPNVLFDAVLGDRQLDKPLLILPGQSDWTRQHLFEKAAQIAHCLVDCGVKKGDRVAAQIDKSPMAVALYLGCLQCGAVFLPLNTAYTASEIEYFLNDATPLVMVCDPDNYTQISEVITSNASLASVQLMTLDKNGSGDLAESICDLPTTFSTLSVGPDDLAAILYTSGTTGRSKGAMLTHNNLRSNAKTLAKAWQFTQDDVLLHALPIYHTHGLFTAINTLMLVGGSMIFLSKFDTEQVIKLLPSATAMMGVPTFYTRLLDAEEFNRSLVDHMRVFISGSAPLLAETHIQFEQRTGKRILERYGMTETNMNTSNPYSGERRAGTVGFALDGVYLRIRDPESGKDIKQGNIGVVEVRGPNVFKGYWQNPEKTAEDMTEDGFFITGDLALIDDDGYLQIVGRGKDLIISGGFNVYPKEIELCLDELPGVLESAVIGAPHRDFGEGIVAAIVLEKDAAFNEESVKAALASGLAKFKQPKRYVLVNELPRNAMGKVQKNVLREQFADVFS